MTDDTPIRLLGASSDGSNSDESSLLEVLSSLGVSAEQQEQLKTALGGMENLEKAVQQLSDQLGGSAVPHAQEANAVADAAGAHALSKNFFRSVGGALGAALHPMAAAQAVDVARALAAQRDASGGSDAGGHHRSLLLPSGTVLHYQEYGKSSAPTLVLLHDINDGRAAWHGVARAAAASHHVLALDLRGHGDTSRSPRRLYGLDDLLGDVHELVVQLSLNGKDWSGATFTRPWVMAGCGLGAAVATAYAARHPGRVGALLLCDYDPEWRRDRLAYDLWQTSTFGGEHEAAAGLDLMLGLGGDVERIGRALATRVCPLDAAADDAHAGLAFRMDPFFFVSDLTAHNARCLLTSAARHAITRIVHVGGGRGPSGHVGDGGGWGDAHTRALAEALRDGGALDATSVSIGGERALPLAQEDEALAAALLELAAAADAEPARAARLASLAAPPPPKPGAMVAADALPEEVVALQAQGVDAHALGAMGRTDRAALKAKLKDLGYKSMRQRIKLEEALIALPPRPK
jgi:pimeloyl-ACP methyl ester carboxylesterase